MRCLGALEAGTAEMQSIIIISSEEFSFEDLLDQCLQGIETRVLPRDRTPA